MAVAKEAWHAPEKGWAYILDAVLWIAVHKQQWRAVTCVSEVLCTDIWELYQSLQFDTDEGCPKPASTDVATDALSRIAGASFSELLTAESRADNFSPPLRATHASWYISLIIRCGAVVQLSRMLYTKAGKRA